MERMDVEALVEVLVEAVADKPVPFVIMDRVMGVQAVAAAAKVVKAVRAAMEQEVLLEFILTTTVQMETFGIVSFNREQQEAVVLVAMAVLAVTEALAEVSRLTVPQKLVTGVLVVPVALEEPEEREAMEPTE
jgi:Flp pilus assembly protein protease CpaA